MHNKRWMWTEDWNKEDDGKIRVVLFRAAFSGRQETARIRITADTRYKLYVNQWLLDKNSCTPT